jgi:hypothetical protein
LQKQSGLEQKGLYSGKKRYLLKSNAPGWMPGGILFKPKNARQ